jgi:hypothetical protein
VEVLDAQDIPEIFLAPATSKLRCLHYTNGSDLFFFVNEADSTYQGKVTLPVSIGTDAGDMHAGGAYAYNAWGNRLETVAFTPGENGTVLSLVLEPYKSLIVIFDKVDPQELAEPLSATGREIPLPPIWRRSLCASIDYPRFTNLKEIMLPDNLAKEKPKFSGFVRYENEFSLDRVPSSAVLEISDAWEGVEVYVNGASAGIQIVPTYFFDVTHLIQPGKNQIAIEVATTLERERAAGKRGLVERLQARKVKDPTGITGLVRLYAKEQETAK